jgi:hypothetical protein
MNQFIERHSDEIAGVLSGFDRVLFRGTLRALFALPVMDRYLASKHVLYKDFGEHARAVSEQLKRASLARAEREGRPIQYLPSSNSSKEEIAREIAVRDKIDSGLICVLSCVEPCVSFDIFRDAGRKELVLQRRERKCLHIYQYWMDPQLGFLHGRIQTWFPFPIQICLNGREWLTRQMEAAGLGYRRRGNCLVSVEDYGRAQALLDQQCHADWPALLGTIQRELNPAHEEIFGNFRADYYWSTRQSEWATDLVFRRAERLQQLYPRFLRHGMTSFGCVDVLRFLGRSLTTTGHIPGATQYEVMSDLKTRQEGARLKHWANGNTIKIYDKAYSRFGNVLRVETTIYQERDFQVYRPKEGDPDGKLAWRPLRRGVADLYRRAEISQAANDRYLSALATIDETATVEELAQRLERPVEWGGRKMRGLRLFDAEDAALLAAISSGDFLINGLRNRDLRSRIFARGAADQREAKSRCAKTSRLIRLLRAHGLLRKIAKTHRYQVTEQGRVALTAIAAARTATIAQLTAIAA